MTAQALPSLWDTTSVEIETYCSSASPHERRGWEFRSGGGAAPAFKRLFPAQRGGGGVVEGEWVLRQRVCGR